MHVFHALLLFTPHPQWIRSKEEEEEEEVYMHACVCVCVCMYHESGFTD